MLVAPGAFTRDFWLFNEGRRAIIALEMLQRRDWLIPRLMGDPILTKPPLFYWLEVICFRLFSPTDWAARIPSLLAGIAGAVALTRLLEIIFPGPGGRQSAFFGGLCLVIFPLYAWMAQSAEPEMLFVATGLAAFWCFAEIAFNGHTSWRWRLGLYLFASLSFMAKGPGMPVTLLLTSVLWLPLVKQGEIRRRFSPLVGLLILLAPALVWGLLLLRSGIHVQAFFGEVSSHFEGDAPHAKPFTYYLDDLRYFVFPWVYILLPALLLALAGAWRGGGRTLGGMAQRMGTYLRQGRGERLFLILWFVSAVLVLSVVSSKRYYYALSIVPPVAGFCAMAHHDLLSFRLDCSWLERRKKLIMTGLLLAAMMFLLGAIIVKDKDGWQPWSGEGSLNKNITLLFMAMLFAGFAFLLSRFEKYGSLLPVRLVHWTLLLSAMTAGYHQLIIHPRLNQHLSLKIAANAIKGIQPDTHRLFSIAGNHTIWFYLQRPDIPDFGEPEKIIAAVRRDPGLDGVVYDKNLDKADRCGQYSILYESKHIPNDLKRSRVYLIHFDRILDTPLPSAED